jgi:hypothetical protein
MRVADRSTEGAEAPNPFLSAIFPMKNDCITTV